MLIRNCSCCPTPPEPPSGECYCPDPCMFTMTVVEPIQYGPQPLVPCVGTDVELGATSPNTIGSECVESVNEQIDPDYVNTTPDDFSFTSCRIDTYQTGYAPFAIIGAQVAAQTRFSRSEAFSGEAVPIVLTEAVAGAYLRCLDSDPRTGELLDGPRLFMQVFIQIASRYLRAGANQTGADIPVLSSKLTQNFGYYEVEAECDDKANSTCEELGRFDTNALRPASPLEFTVSVDDSGFGPWPATNTPTGGQSTVTEGSEVAWECHDAMAAGFTPTFRLAERVSCEELECDCGVSLFTMKALFDGKEFTVGEEFEHYEDAGDGFEKFWGHYENANIYYFYYERWLGPGKQLLYERRAATLFCDNDEESSPTVQRWYVEFEMKCRTYDGNFSLIEETTKTEIGYFVCGLGEFCGGLAGDQPVPLGSPTEIEEVPGSPVTTDGLDPCTPPARPSLTVSCE